jgi:16S rRNA (uracil1498-N3)-methyltransferase
LRQFYLETVNDASPVPGELVVLDSDESHHLFTVLRGGRDQILHLTDGRGNRFTGKVNRSDRRRAEVEILTRHEDLAEVERPQLILACAAVKTKRFEWALEKAVEIGAHRVITLQTEHGVIEPGKGKVKRWQTIMKSALKQSARSWLPELVPNVSLEDYLAQMQAPCYFGAVPGDVDGPVPGAHEIPATPDAVPDQISLMIGPEGGWSAEERTALVSAGCLPIQLGPHILRTETAVVAGLQVLQIWRQAWRSSRKPSG